MKQKSQFKGSESPLFQEPKIDIKILVFQTIHSMLNSSQIIHFLFYIIVTFLEAVQLLWYIVHPDFNLFQSSTVMSYLRQMAKFLNFHQFAKTDHSLAIVFLSVAISYIAIQTIVFCISVYQTIGFKNVNSTISTIQHILFYLFNTILIVPFFGISINVLYCDSTNSYHTGQTCYDSAYIGKAFIAAIILLNIVVQKAGYCYIYFDTNPFVVSYFSKNNNNSELGRFLIKILPIIYFIVDEELLYKNVSLFANVGLYGGYIFFFRFNSVHDYNQVNFYISYFFELFLTWFSFNNIILLYLQTQNFPGGVFQSIACAILISALFIYFEKMLYQKIFIEVIQTKNIKKPSSQKFFYYLIYKFVHDKSEQGRSMLEIEMSVLCLNSQQFNSQQEQVAFQEKQVQSKDKQRQNIFYKRTRTLLVEYLKNSTSVMFQSLLCAILMFQNTFSLAYHKSIQMSMRRLSLVEELMFYRLRKHKRFQQEPIDFNIKEKGNLFKLYKQFNQNVMMMECLIHQCVLNNLEYWQQLQEYNPSIHKIRNLAQNYKKYQVKIKQTSNKIQLIFPNNKQFRKLYLQFLMFVGVVGIKQLDQAIEKYTCAVQNQRNSLKFRKAAQIRQLGQNQDLIFISIDTAQNNKCNIINCNSEVKKMLNFQKQQILNKNIGKLMPKIFMQFHDDLVMNYIKKKEKDQQNKVQKIVYAFNNQNILVEVALFTSINYRLNNSNLGLQLIGFLKKIDNGTKSVILIQMNSELVIGFTSRFQKLVEFGINTTQISNNQIRLRSIMPKIQMQKIRNGEVQTTNLIFTSKTKLTKVGINQQIKKKVQIQVQQIKQYNGKLKLAYLKISQTEGTQHLSATAKQNLTQDVKLQQQVKNQENKLKFVINKNSNEQNNIAIASKVSIMSQSDSLKDAQKQYQLVSTNEVQTQNNSTLQRKKTQFISSYKLTTYINIISFVLFTYLAINIVLTILCDIFNTKNINNMQQTRILIFKSNDINYHATVINLNVQRLIQTQKYYNNQSFVKFQDELSKSVSDSRNHFFSLLSSVQRYKNIIQLDFNQFYQFQFYKCSINMSISGYQTWQSYQGLTDAYFQYLSFSQGFALLTYEEITTNFEQQYNEQNSFMQANGRSIFLQIFGDVAQKYQSASKIIFEKHSKDQVFIQVGMGLTLLGGFALIYYLIIKINLFNAKSIQLYNCLRLWDIRQMRFKIVKYLKINEPSLYRSNSKRLSANSVLQLFPNQAFLSILKENFTTNNRKTLDKSSKTIKKLDKLINQQKLDVFPFQQQTEKLQQQKLIEASLIKKKYNVFLQQKNKINFKILSILAFCLIFFGIFLGVSSKTTSVEKQILDLNKNILKLSQIKSEFGIFNYYFYQIILGNEQDLYYTLLKQKLNSFYQVSNQQHNSIQHILENTYSQIQENVYIIENLIIGKTNYNFTVLDQRFLTSQFLFAQTSNQLDTLINNDLAQLGKSLGSDINSMFTLMTIVQLMGICVAGLITYCWLISSITNSSRKSRCMLQLVPIWMIPRNKQLYKLLQQN